MLSVLILCTGNSARSILAEALLNARGAGRLRAYSAGSHPKSDVHPLALELLSQRGLPIEGLRSKRWDEFAGRDAPAMRLVITVCDNAAGEVCPVWPGAPVQVHWGIEDPAAVRGEEPQQRAAFASAYEQLAERVDALLALPLENLSARELREALQEIGRRANGATHAATDWR